MTTSSATDEVIEQAQSSVTLMNKLYSDIPPMTEEAVIQTWLLLAKAAPSDQEIAEAAIYLGLLGLGPGHLKDWNVEELARKPERARDWWEKTGSHRRKFRSRLDELVNDLDRAISKRQSASIKILRRDLLIGTRLDDKGDPIHRYIPMTIEAAYEYVLQKLYNKENQTWKRLRKCSHCRSYFLRSAGGAGGRPRDYCTPECQKKSDQKKALIRQRKARQRKSK